MAVDDLWRLRDGSPSKRDGRGKRWRVRVEGYPGTLHRTRAEAQRVELERLQAGPPKPASTVMVGELLDKWLAGKAGLSPKGLQACRGDAVHVRVKWGKTLAAEVTAADVQEWIANLTVVRGTKAAPIVKPASEALRRRLVQCLTASLAIGGHALDKIRVPRDHAREPYFLTVDQLGELADAAGDYAPMVWLLGTCGLRIGEACALNVGDVDRKRRRLRVRQAKGLRGRDVPIPKKVLEMLNLGKRPADEPLFVSSKGTRIDKDNWRARRWVPAVAAVGLEGMHIHDLRHTAASLAIASGADVKVVQTMLGHKSATLTLDLYGHLMDDRLDAVAKAIDRML